MINPNSRLLNPIKNTKVVKEPVIKKNNKSRGRMGLREFEQQLRKPKNLNAFLGHGEWQQVPDELKDLSEYYKRVHNFNKASKSLTQIENRRPFGKPAPTLNRAQTFKYLSTNDWPRAEPPFHKYKLLD